MKTNKDFMPISIDVRNKKILLIGGGKVAFDKLKTLLNYSANIVVIDELISDEIKQTGVKYIEKDYEFSDIHESFMVFAYTENNLLNQQIRLDCELSSKLVNVADNQDEGDFKSPVVFRKSNMSIAVSSNENDVTNSLKVVNSIRRIFQHDKFLMP